jgi:hypothetical protein
MWKITREKQKKINRDEEDGQGLKQFLKYPFYPHSSLLIFFSSYLFSENSQINLTPSGFISET